MSTTSDASNSAGSQKLSSVATTEKEALNKQFHEVGLLFRHFHADLKLENLQPEAFNKAPTDERARIQDQMSALLDRTRTRDEMFPDSGLTFWPGRHYLKVHSDEIELNFPQADTDLRALLRRFSQLFRTTYVRKMFLKRISFCIIMFLLYYYATWIAYMQFVMHSSHERIDSSLVIIAIIYFIAGIPTFALYFMVSAALDQQFENALQQSCIAVSQNTLQRLAALKACIDNIQVAIRDLYDQEEEKWMVQSNYLMALMIWLPLRVLHIERYFQMTMWRVHREFVYIQYIAIALQLSIFLAAVEIIRGLDPGLFVGHRAGVIIYLAFTAFFSVLSFLGASTNVRFVHDNIPIDQWKTFGALKMDTVVSGVVGFLIKKFIMLRDVGRSTSH